MSSVIGGTAVESLNRTLAAELGRGPGGSEPRFAWKWAPDQPWFVYDRDERTILRKSWADAPDPNGGTIGRVWVLAEYRHTKAEDHCGYGAGVRIAVTKKADHFPYFETALREGAVPTEALNANYVWALKRQLDMSAEMRPDSFAEWMAEEKYSADANLQRQRQDHLEQSRHVYDDNVGGFGNCVPGTAGGFLSWGGVGAT